MFCITTHGCSGSGIAILYSRFMQSSPIFIHSVFCGSSGRWNHVPRRRCSNRTVQNKAFDATAGGLSLVMVLPRFFCGLLGLPSVNAGVRDRTDGFLMVNEWTCYNPVLSALVLLIDAVSVSFVIVCYRKIIRTIGSRRRPTSCRLALAPARRIGILLVHHRSSGLWAVA